ncbi:MAG: ABC transporter ATP-binding protein [Dehalococcoidia bacterium]|jgi:multiple sugar transport system ATP-binding protein|nr:ABC transporter ATP-binding protein [Dehalococcoidia bacterium]
MAKVKIENVSINFGTTAALSNINFEVKNSEFFILLGPTGAGKTTTLRLISGLERPDSGKILIDGIDVTKVQPAYRDTAFVFQQYSLYPNYSVFDNLAFPLRSPLRKESPEKIKQRVLEIATLLKIENKLNNSATELSGGEMQRVAIGRALVRTPNIYLMDEPLSSLDAKLRGNLRVELKRIQKELGATILYVTHDQIEAMTMADRIGVLREGELIQIGTPSEIYSSPADTYVACRLGSPQINLLPKDLFDFPEIPAETKTLGIRPEDVILGSSKMEGTVSGIENLGADTILLLNFNEHEVFAYADPRKTYSYGDVLKVGIDPEKTLFFDAQDQLISA